jgi:hypothetical protein
MALGRNKPKNGGWLGKVCMHAGFHITHSFFRRISWDLHRQVAAASGQDSSSRGMLGMSSTR